jgi:pimeloyl-ACP methyl ester carboxylesterase
VGLIGHSLGAYTALALAGGRPTASPQQSPDGQPHAIPVSPDRRVRALVLLAPATVWYTLEGALADVDLPILLWLAEKDDVAPAFHGDIVRRGVRDARRIEERLLPGGGHFSFCTPFPPERVRPDFPPSQDPPGFDRAAMQPLIHAAVATFLRETLRA